MSPSSLFLPAYDVLASLQVKVGADEGCLFFLHRLSYSHSHSVCVHLLALPVPGLGVA